MRAAGSAPGVAKKIRKTTMLIPSMTKSIWKKRRISRLSMGSSDSELGPWIERVTHPVAQHIERKDAEDDGDAWSDGNPGAGIEYVLAILDNRAPACVRRLDSDGEEGEGGFRQHVERQHERHEDDQRRHHIGQDVADQD